MAGIIGQVEEELHHTCLLGHLVPSDISVDVREWVAQAVMSELDLGPVQRGKSVKLDRRGSRGGSGK